MELRGEKLGILISCPPDSHNFRHGLGLASAAIKSGVDVYLYCIDDAVRGVEDSELQVLQGQGVKLYACAYGANRRSYPLTDKATFAGLTVVTDLIAGTDRFVSFN